MNKFVLLTSVAAFSLASGLASAQTPANTDGKAPAVQQDTSAKTEKTTKVVHHKGKKVTKATHAKAASKKVEAKPVDTAATPATPAPAGK